MEQGSGAENAGSEGDDAMKEGGQRRRWAKVVRRNVIGCRPADLASALEDPLTAVRLLTQSPQVALYTALKHRLSLRETAWLSAFLGEHGLELLFDNLEAISHGHPTSSFFATVLQIGCVECIRTIMDSEVSLECIIENEDFIPKFSQGKDGSTDFCYLPCDVSRHSS